MRRFEVREKLFAGHEIVIVGRLDGDATGMIIVPRVDSRLFFKDMGSTLWYFDPPLDPGTWSARHYVSTSSDGTLKADVRFMIVGPYRTERTSVTDKFLKEHLPS